MKKIIMFLLVVTLILFPVTVSANKNCKIEIETLEATIGETIFIDVNIKDNPGISAVTISVSYDSSTLEFADYKKGIFSDCSVKNFEDKNLIRIVALEDKDVKVDGTLVSLGFMVKKFNNSKTIPITLQHNSGDFCNVNGDIVSPKVISGAINQRKTNNAQSSSQSLEQSSSQTSSQNSSLTSSQSSLNSIGNQTSSKPIDTSSNQNQSSVTNYPNSKDTSSTISQNSQTIENHTSSSNTNETVSVSPESSKETNSTLTENVTSNNSQEVESIVNQNGFSDTNNINDNKTESTVKPSDINKQEEPILPSYLFIIIAVIIISLVTAFIYNKNKK